MAVLEKIRSHSVLLVVVIGIALAGFVVGDLFTSGRTFWSKSERTALSIDDKDVSIEEYSVRLKELEDQAQAQGQQLSDEQRMQLNNQLAQEYISEYALTEVTSRVGLGVSDEELYALLVGKGIAPSPLASQFFGTTDEQQINDLIKRLSDKQIQAAPAEQRAQLLQAKSQFEQLQKQIKSQRLQQKLTTLLSRTYKINDVDRELALGKESRSIALVRTSAAMITDEAAKPSDSEVKKYYDEHPDFYKMQYPLTEVSYISLQVVPSQADYKVALDEKNKAVAELRTATASNIEEVLRGYTTSSKFFSKTFLTGAELDELGLGAEQVAFIKGSEAGAVNDPQLVSDRYDVVKLVGKKMATSGVSVRMIVLSDSVKGQADSIMAQLNSGASFAELAKKHSLDQSTAASGGLIQLPNRYGMVDSTFSESKLIQIAQGSGLNLDTLYKVPVGTVVRLGRAPISVLVRAENPQPAVESYQVAFVSIPATFSPETYNEKYAAMNRILGGGGGFEAMAKKAEKEGFSVARNIPISTQSPALGQIPSSRQVISWALNAKEGEVGQKLYTCGTDYLVIPTVVKHTPAGIAPLSAVREEIVAYLSGKKKAEMLAKNLEAKHLASLDAYATELQTKVDTLVDVSYIVRGSEPATFNGVAMTTPMGKLSKPFAANNAEVMVLQPVAATPNDPAAVSAQIKQQELGLARQYSYRVFANVIQNLKIKDNRGRFY